MFHNNEEFQRQAANYEKSIKTPEWKFLVSAVRLIQGKMLEHMVSKDYTDSSPEEKDIIQKTYFQINQILAFLISPQAWIQKRSKWKEFLSNQMGKVKPNQKEGT